jgi:hypothetical protein
MSNEEPQNQGKGRKRDAVKQSLQQGIQSLGARWDRFRGKSKSPGATRSSTPQHTELPPSNAAGSSRGRDRFLDVPNRYPDILDPPVHGVLTALRSISHRIGGAHWVEPYSDQSIQHNPTTPLLDIELVEERDSIPEDLPQLAVPQAPTRESSHLSSLPQRPTMDIAMPPKKAVSPSSHGTQGVFVCIPTRYGFPRLV